MRIGKIIKIIKRPDGIPIKLPPKKNKGIPAPNWPAKQPARRESENVPRI